MEQDQQQPKTEDRKDTHRVPLDWEAHEYAHADKTPEWYWALGLTAVAGAVAALMFNNVLFAVLILIIAFVLAIFGGRKPSVVKFSLTQRGIRIDDEIYPFQSLKSFAIDEHTPNVPPKLIFASKKPLVPHMIIPLEGVNADAVHDFLRDFLPEEDHMEPLSHKVMEWLGF